MHQHQRSAGRVLRFAVMDRSGRIYPAAATVRASLAWLLAWGARVVQRAWQRWRHHRHPRMVVKESDR
jgi:hypothetical protein